MLWFIVWTVLVVGTLVGAFFLLRSLYRSARALIAEGGHAGEVLGKAADRAAELEAAQSAWTPPPVVLDDPEPARARRVLTAAATARRRAARRARPEASYERWRAFSR